MIRIRTLATVVLASIGCGGGFSPLPLDPTFTLEERLSIENASLHLCDGSGGAACVDVSGTERGPRPRSWGEVVDRDLGSIWRAAPGDPLFAAVEARPELDHYRAFTVNKTSIVIFPSRLPPDHEVWTTTALHELGHVVGLSHEEGEERSSWGRRPCVDAPTLMALCEEGLCEDGAGVTC